MKPYAAIKFVEEKQVTLKDINNILHVKSR